jgi:hypothetical protein
MEQIRGNYYEGVIIDTRRTFISGQGSAEDCINYLSIAENSEKEEEYSVFLSFIKTATQWDNELMIIRRQDWNEFYNSDDEECEMKIFGHIMASDFLSDFGYLIGIDNSEFENYFVGAKYIDNQNNIIEIIIRLNESEETFIIDMV